MHGWRGPGMRAFAVALLFILAGGDIAAGEYRKQCALATLKFLDEHQYNPTTRVYCEFSRSKNRAGIWGWGVMMKAFSALAKDDPKYVARMKAYFDAAASYAPPRTPPGKGVYWWRPKGVTEKFIGVDDNSMLAWSLLEAHRATKNTAYLKLAKEIVDTLLETDLWLKEGWAQNSEKKDLPSGHTTANMANNFVLLWEATGDKKYREYADKALSQCAYAMPKKGKMSMWPWAMMRMVEAMLTYYEVTWNGVLLRRCRDYANEFIARFYDTERGGIRMKVYKDRSIGTHGAPAAALIRLYEHTEKQTYITHAEAAISFFNRQDPAPESIEAHGYYARYDDEGNMDPTAHIPWPGPEGMEGDVRFLPFEAEMLRLHAMMIPHKDIRDYERIAQKAIANENWGEAAASLEALAHVIDPANGTWHRMLAECYLKLGKNAEATKELETALRLAPDDERAREMLRMAH